MGVHVITQSYRHSGSTTKWPSAMFPSTKVQVPLCGVYEPEIQALYVCSGK